MELPLTLRNAYGEDAWRVVPRTFQLPDELPEWRAHLDAGGARDGATFFLKTNAHRGEGLLQLPAEEAYEVAAPDAYDDDDDDDGDDEEAEAGCAAPARARRACHGGLRPS